MENNSVFNKKIWFAKVLPWLLLAVTLAVTFYVHDRNGLYEDDLWYATNLVTGEPLHSISDVVESQVWHYFNWGGRSMAHGLLQLSILGGGRFIDICNVLATVLLVFLIGLFTKEKNAWKYVAAVGLVISLNPNLERNWLWQSGVANYLYMSLFIVLYMWVYVRELQANEKKLPGAAVWMIPIGLLAGWSNENMGPAIWLGSMAVMYFYCKQHKKPKAFMITGNISCLMGSLLLIAAPGNFVRAEQAVNAYDTRLYRQVLNRVFWVSRAVFDYLFPALLVLGFLILIYVVFLKQRLDKADGILLMVAVLSVGAMLLSPHYPDRATFGTLVILVIEAVKLLFAIGRKGERVYSAIAGISVLFWLAAMYDYANWIILHLNLSW